MQKTKRRETPPPYLSALKRPVRLRRADTEGVILDRREGSRAPPLRVTLGWGCFFVLLIRLALLGTFSHRRRLLRGDLQG